MVYESLFVAGRSGAGKTTAIKGLRGGEYESSLVVPRRYVAPGLRQNDDSDENEIIGIDEFDVGVAQGDIELPWSRPLGDDRRQFYGFQALPPEDQRLRVYSANNDFLRNGSRAIGQVLASGLVVLMSCNDSEIADRLARRSPDLSPEERGRRMQDTGADILEMGFRHLVEIHTTGMEVDDCQLAFRSLVDSVLMQRI